jgi:hypothetical protein
LVILTFITYLAKILVYEKKKRCNIPSSIAKKIWLEQCGHDLEPLLSPSAGKVFKLDLSLGNKLPREISHLSQFSLLFRTKSYDFTFISQEKQMASVLK